ncbi:MAG: 4Fe-4S dicluster domain-containing protein [Pseudomonadota bacterium]
MEKYLIAFPDLCTGCNRCVYVCSGEKEGMFIPRLARIHAANFPIKGYSVPLVCFQCPKADCQEACPEKAISRDNLDVVVVDGEKCTGCGECVKACPYGMIELNDQGRAFKCDYCGGDPACVKECEPRALVFGELSTEAVKARGFQMKQRVDDDSAEEKRSRRARAILAQSRD